MALGSSEYLRTLKTFSNSSLLFLSFLNSSKRESRNGERGFSLSTNFFIRFIRSLILISKNFSASVKHSVFNTSIVRLDGLLKAPSEFKNQKTIIKGDEKDVWIACASIVAKVSRDRLMTRLARKYPYYNFEIHKGYGTTLHRKLIQKLGLSNLHRTSFAKNLTKLVI